MAGVHRDAGVGGAHRIILALERLDEVTFDHEQQAGDADVAVASDRGPNDPADFEVQIRGNLRSLTAPIKQAIEGWGGLSHGSGPLAKRRRQCVSGLNRPVARTGPKRGGSSRNAGHPDLRDEPEARRRHRLAAGRAGEGPATLAAAFYHASPAPSLKAASAMTVGAAGYGVAYRDPQ